MTAKEIILTDTEYLPPLNYAALDYVTLHLHFHNKSKIKIFLSQMDIFYTLSHSFFKINFNLFPSSKLWSCLIFSKPYLFFSFLRTIIIVLSLILDNTVNFLLKCIAIFTVRYIHYLTLLHPKYLAVVCNFISLFMLDLKTLSSAQTNE